MFTSSVLLLNIYIYLYRSAWVTVVSLSLSFSRLAISICHRTSALRVRTSFRVPPSDKKKAIDLDGKCERQRATDEKGKLINPISEEITGVNMHGKVIRAAERARLLFGMMIIQQRGCEEQ